MNGNRAEEPEPDGRPPVDGPPLDRPCLPPFTIPPLPLIPYPESLVDTVSQAVALYFDMCEVPYPMLHRTRFLADPKPTSLLVSSIMLLVPNGMRAVGLQAPTHWKNWDRPMFARTAAEAAALLASGRKTRVEDIAALLNIHIWGIVSGMSRLAGQMLSIVQSLAQRDGHLDAPSGNWSTVAARYLSPILQHGILESEKRTLLRNHWIDHHVRLRLSHLILELGQLHSSWARREPPPKFDFSILKRHAHPMPRVWQLSFDPEFDPRLVEDEPEISEALEFLIDQRVSPNPEILGRRLAGTRLQLLWTTILLRNKLDRYLAAVDAGVPNLEIKRLSIANELAIICSSFPPAIRRALIDGSASALLAAYAPYSGNPVHTFNTVVLFLVLDFMQVELHTSAAAYFALCEDGTTSLADLQTARGRLADDFASGGSRTAVLLAQCVAATRVLEGLSKISTIFLSHAAYTLAFRLGCLHAALLARVYASGVRNVVTRDMEHDIAVCVNLLRSYKNPISHALVSLAERAILGTSLPAPEIIGKVAGYAEDADLAVEGVAEAKRATDEFGGMIAGAYGR